MDDLDERPDARPTRNASSGSLAGGGGGLLRDLDAQRFDPVLSPPRPMSVPMSPPSLPVKDNSNLLLPLPNSAHNSSTLSFSLSDAASQLGPDAANVYSEIAGADLHIAADGSYVETTSAHAARELKKRYDQMLHVGTDKNVRSPYIITALQTAEKQVFRISQRPITTVAEPGEPLSVQQTSPQSRNNSIVRRARLSVNGFLPPSLFRNAAGTTKATGPAVVNGKGRRILRKTSISDISSSNGYTPGTTSSPSGSLGPPVDVFSSFSGWSQSGGTGPPSSRSSSRPSLDNPGDSDTEGNYPYSRFNSGFPFGAGVTYTAPTRNPDPPTLHLAPTLPTLRLMQSFESGLTARADDRPTPVINDPLSRPSILSPETNATTPYSPAIFEVLQTFRGVPLPDTLSANSAEPTIKLSSTMTPAPRDDPRFVIWGHIHRDLGDAALSHSSHNSNTDVSPPSVTGLGRRKSLKDRTAAASSDTQLDGPKKVLMAATIERWIAQLTSELNYDELLHFFLTYRTYINSVDLCCLLVCRFHWALEKPTSTQDATVRRIVCVRTFLAFRYWLLTFFRVDFLENRLLCVTLTTWLNMLQKDIALLGNPDAASIVRKLKKVVRDCKAAHSKAVIKPTPSEAPTSYSALPGTLSSKLAAPSSKVVHASPDDADVDLDFDFDQRRGSVDHSMDEFGVFSSTRLSNLDVNDTRPSDSEPALPSLGRVEAMTASQVMLQQPLHMTILTHSKAPASGSSSATLTPSSSSPHPLPLQHGTISRFYVNTIGRLGRWKRVLNARTGGPGGSGVPGALNCHSASSFDLELNGDVLTVRGGMEEYLRMLNLPPMGDPGSEAPEFHPGGEVDQSDASPPALPAKDHTITPLPPLMESSGEDTEVEQEVELDDLPPTPLSAILLDSSGKPNGFGSSQLPTGTRATFDSDIISAAGSGPVHEPPSSLAWAPERRQPDGSSTAGTDEHLPLPVLEDTQSPPPLDAPSLPAINVEALEGMAPVAAPNGPIPHITHEHEADTQLGDRSEPLGVLPPVASEGFSVAPPDGTSEVIDIPSADIEVIAPTESENDLASDTLDEDLGVLEEPVLPPGLASRVSISASGTSDSSSFREEVARSTLDDRSSFTSGQRRSIASDEHSGNDRFSIATYESSVMSFGEEHVVSRMGDQSAIPRRHADASSLEVVSLDDYDLSDSGSGSDGERPANRKLPRRLPLRRDFRFVRHSEVSSLGIRSDTHSSAASSSAVSERSGRSTGPGAAFGHGAIQTWQIDIIDSDDDEPGDVEAALRRLEGQIDKDRQKAKEIKVDGWLKHVQERLAAGGDLYDYRHMDDDDDDEEPEHDPSEQPHNVEQGADPARESKEEHVEHRNLPFVEVGPADESELIPEPLALSTDDASVAPPASSEDGRSLSLSIPPISGSPSTPTPERLAHAVHDSNAHSPLEDKSTSDNLTPLTTNGKPLHRTSHSLSRKPSLNNVPPGSRVAPPANFSTQQLPTIHRSLVLVHRSQALAEQFGLIDRELFMSIRFEELVVDWKDPLEDVPVYDWAAFQRERSRMKAQARRDGLPTAGNNLLAVRGRYNHMVNFTSSEIVLSPPGERHTVAGKLIRVAWKCYLLNNFATLVAIVDGLQTNAATRAMSRSWGRVGTWEMRLFDDFRAFTKPDGNFKHIRDAIASLTDGRSLNDSASAGGLGSAVGPPKPRDEGKLARNQDCIPFIGIYLTQLHRFAQLPDYVDPTSPTSVVTFDPITGHLNPPLHPEVFSNLPPLPQSLTVEPIINVHKQRLMAGVIKSFVKGQHVTQNWGKQFIPDRKLYQKCSRLRCFNPTTQMNLIMVMNLDT